MSNPNAPKRFGWPHLLALVVLVAFAVGIALLRQKTTHLPTVSGDSIQVSPPVTIATPDTTTADIDTIVQDASVASDTMAYELAPVHDVEVSPDRRPADKAGYEDGTIAGRQDATTQQYKATYDETNSFIGPDNDIYVHHYRQAYEAAYHQATASNAQNQSSP